MNTNLRVHGETNDPDTDLFGMRAKHLRANTSGVLPIFADQNMS